MSELTESEARAVMKKCQLGFPRHMIDESNNLHAECYRTIGGLLHEVELLEAQIQTLTKASQPVGTEPNQDWT